MFTDTVPSLQAGAPGRAPAGVPDRGALRAALLGRPVPHPLPQPRPADHHGGQRLAQVLQSVIVLRKLLGLRSLKTESV